MYSDDYDSLDDEALVPRKNKTTPPPPPIYSFEDLESFQIKFSTKHVIICAVDFETVDNYVGSDLDKMSEIGITIYDPRTSPSTSTLFNTTSTTSQSNKHLEDLGRLTTAHHILIDEWKHETEMTCKAFWHKGRKNKSGKPHKARPYHCQFARSTVLSRDESINWLKALLRRLTTQNRTAEEIKNGDEREVRLLFWDSGLEDRIFCQADIHLPELGKDIQGWDLQAWCPFRIRFNNGVNNGQASGEMAFASLGVLGTTSTTVLHNATNDTVAQLLSFLRMTVMTEDEWKAWFDERVDFSPISIDWLDESIYEDNISRAPRTQKRHQPRTPMQGHGNHVTYNGKHGQCSNTKPSSSWKEPRHRGNYNRHCQNGTPGPCNTTSPSNTRLQESHQQVTTLRQNLGPEAANVTGAVTEIASLSQEMGNIHLQDSDVHIQVKCGATEVEKGYEGDHSSGRKGGASRKQRARKKKAVKREECSRQIPGLS
ncbi:hypothetical protein GE21DRAFT_5339 [Neurospora crassa]|uniref:Gfd2/YDR514C-like C-terminal domain-containing protein n=1 Tax=Neurospora crassa (strain ATCC 24698 / 74-OR23-1A / CBS 708.71 / DSM 1257 / FGSC 987) TaxID=367110 RepID=Q7S1E4_NEUCR|nr:hypothetical protein NCU04891 [Neurospora crassa OR74A]EAA29164.1 hypothetical protein NCU04891 [Neurospora crassa OR74A]KHE78850.1 hypothetical protein GE21DRAFT_5339 [Neurospora crassa]|eukprot:XP_958400.1 hypothetical protein NCU04891 [Neurospora crassa OR74A]